MFHARRCAKRKMGTMMKRNRTIGLSLLTSVPIGCLGGLIGLGGAEFRLPVLVGLFKKAPKKAVALNMTVSLITIISSICFRLPRVSLGDLQPLLIIMVAIIAGSMTGAYFGADLARKITDSLFKRVLLVLLILVGLLLITESVLPFMSGGIPFAGVGAVIVAAIVCGLGIGVFSSLLGVAGGELIIPTLILVFGVDAKLAGTMSLIISLPTIIIGIARHAANGLYADKEDLGTLVAPMGVGSIIGAFIGAALVAYVSSGVIKLLLGVLLIFSAVKIFTGKGESKSVKEEVKAEKGDLSASMPYDISEPDSLTVHSAHENQASPQGQRAGVETLRPPV